MGGQPTTPFSANDLERLRTGNLQLRRLLPLLNELLVLGIPFVLENPAYSYLWSVPALRRIARNPKADEIFVDQCAWGRKWRKRTRLLCVHCDPADVADLATYTCNGRRRCQYSGCKHVQLTGSGPNSRPLTALAQKFPRGMSTKLGNVLASRIRAQKVRGSWRKMEKVRERSMRLEKVGEGSRWFEKVRESSTKK